MCRLASASFIKPAPLFQGQYSAAFFQLRAKRSDGARVVPRASRTRAQFFPSGTPPYSRVPLLHAALPVTVCVRLCLLLHIPWNRAVSLPLQLLYRDSLLALVPRPCRLPFAIFLDMENLESHHEAAHLSARSGAERREGWREGGRLRLYSKGGTAGVLQGKGRCSRVRRGARAGRLAKLQ